MSSGQWAVGNLGYWLARGNLQVEMSSGQLAVGSWQFGVLVGKGQFAG